MGQQGIAPRISAIVCTFNNARILEQTLPGLASQQLPSQTGYEVVIVDNNSTDATREVAQRFASLPGSVFRYVVETKQGLSFARNRGTEEARGEIVAFIDDDAIADADWLSQLWTTYEREPDAACVGGRVVLKFPTTGLPEWYDPRLDGFLSARDLPYGPAKSEREFPHGTNISFRTSVLKESGGFHPLLGARQIGGIKLQGDETQLCQRLFRKGAAIFFQPAARVVHVVEERRLRKAYFLGLAEANGYLLVILDNDGAIGVSTGAQFIKYLRRWFRRWREYRRARHAFTVPERFWDKMMRRSAWGSVWYCLVAKHQLRRLASELTKSA